MRSPVEGLPVLTLTWIQNLNSGNPVQKRSQLGSHPRRSQTPELPIMVSEFTGIYGDPHLSRVSMAISMLLHVLMTTLAKTDSTSSRRRVIPLNPINRMRLLSRHNQATKSKSHIPIEGENSFQTK
jgi:hypothetical protein